MKNFLSHVSFWEAEAIAVIRIIVGLLMIYHGWEIFSAAKMNEYAAWDSFKDHSSPLIMVYIGKGAELLAGLLLTIGLCTRLAALFLIFTMLYIAFIVADGRVWYEDQHPFLFALLGGIFFFRGGGKWSLDGVIIKKEK